MTAKEETTSEQSKEFLTMVVNGQSFGIPVLQVQDVLSERKVTRVPLTPKDIAGTLNLRGRIVTAINLRHRLRLPPTPEDTKSMYVVVTYKDELYSLIVDSVGEVLSLPDKLFEKTPPTLDPAWKEMSLGIYRLNNQLLVILDVPDMLESLCSKDGHAA